MSWVNAAISVGSAIFGASQQSKAAKKAKKAGKDPLRKERASLAKNLMALVKDPSSFYQNPLYQAAFGQGQQAVMRGLASQGYRNSGNMATGLQEYGQSFGWSQFQNWADMLANWAGFTQQRGAPAVQAAGAMAQGQATQNLLGTAGALIGQYGDQIGSLFGGSSTPITLTSGQPDLGNIGGTIAAPVLPTLD